MNDGIEWIISWIRLFYSNWLMSNHGAMNNGRYWDFVTKYTQIYIFLSDKPFIYLLITLSSYSHIFNYQVNYYLSIDHVGAYSYENYKNKTLKTRKLKIYTNKNMYACIAHTHTHVDIYGTLQSDICLCLSKCVCLCVSLE